MNEKLKKELKAAFRVPLPRGKEQFLQQLRYPKITYREFLLAQLSYIRKRIWMASALIILLGWMTAFHSPMSHYSITGGLNMWSVSAALPFLAMITITEIYRSSAYRMVELEASCRFSLPQIVIARISILGVISSVVLIMLLVFIHRVSTYSLLQTMLYMIIPYLVVCAACLFLLNRTRGSDGIYACAVAAGLVSVASILCKSVVTILYSDAYLNGWLTLFVGCLMLIGFQIHKLVKELEEKQWNLNLTE